MTREQRELLARWLTAVGALALFASLFLTWSHQFSSSFLDRFGASEVLRGVPTDPTAWQVYSVADVLLALLALALIAVAFAGGRQARIGALVACVAALVFALRALSDPPTNGANIFNPALSVPNLYPSGASAGPGETLAITALLAAIAGLGLGLWLRPGADSRIS
ncbi:MAG: hypothetical protein JOZ73_05590 [Solirubrobacterales bacterium]|nr:hypothetical protein [Solirubrobacterales bacterium]